MKTYVIIGIASFFLMLVGCEKDSSDEGLIEITVQQKTQRDDLKRIATRIDGVERRLEEIQQSIDKIPPASGTPEPSTVGEGQTDGPKVVEFKDTPEYGRMAAQLSAIQQRLTLTGGGLTETQQDIIREQEQARLRDPAQAMRAMSDPQEMDRRLTTLAQNFVPTIQDPVKRQQFEADLQQLKRSLSENPSTQELYQRTVSNLTERLNNEQNERAREFIQRQVQSLETASAEELEGRLERYSRFDTMRQLRDIQSKYDIPRETYRDAGIPSMGMERGGPRGGDRGRGGPPGRRGR